MEKSFKGWIRQSAVIRMPIANRNEKRAGQSELRAAIGVAHEKIGVGAKDWLGRAHLLYDNVGYLDFSLMLEFSRPLKPADTRQKLADVMPPPPFAIAYAIDSRLLLKPNRENHHLVH